MTDFLTIAKLYGLPWACVVALAIALTLKDKNSVPMRVYNDLLARGKVHDESLGIIQQSMVLLLELVKRALP
jgi:hypothetical protein